MAKKALKIFYLILILFLALLAGALILSNFNTPLNYRVFNVMSGSMEPAVKTGSLVFIRPNENYKENDIVTFQQGSGSQLTTHRIIEVSDSTIEKSIFYKTKGDANEDIDTSQINKNQVLGKVVFSIPYLGYPLALAKTRIGFLALILIPAAFIIVSEFINIFKEVRLMIRERKTNKMSRREEVTRLL